MTDRNVVTLRYQIGERIAEFKAYDTVGVEDSYDVLLQAAMHRIATGENLAEPIPREVKDWILKLNLFV